MLLFVCSGVASADVTLGSTDQPSGSLPGDCFPNATEPTQGDTIVQATDDPSLSYTVPAGGGAITSWSNNTVGLSAPGTSLTLVVLTPNSGGTYTVVGVDAETIPTSIPGSGIVTYTPATPIKVSGGEKLALYSNDAATGPPICWFGGGSPAVLTLDALTTPTAPAPGQTLSQDAVTGPSPPGFQLDASAILSQSADLSVTKTASASSVDVGGQITYTIKVSNAGPSPATATTLTDALPSQVSFVSATGTAGSCSGSSTVTCNIGTLAAGASATVTIVVNATTAGTATNTAKVSSALPDSNTANNTASVMTTIVKPALKLAVSPHSARAGQHRCYAFTAASSGAGVGGVTVKFAGHTRHTSSAGKATICVTLKRGTYHATATRSGYTGASAKVVVKPAKPKKKKAPTFTG
jgi:uncharacterized repeat protein (TIGR01451 family)